jgi:hypothetical protein
MKCGHERHADIIGRALHPLVNVAYPTPKLFRDQSEVEKVYRQQTVGQRMRLRHVVWRLAVRRDHALLDR